MSSPNEAPTTYSATVMANKARIPASNEGDEVRELIIEIDNAHFVCEAGQSIGILAPLPPASTAPFHLRWYSIADIPTKDQHGRPNITICVRRIVQPDPVSGKPVRGLASNFLCDAQAGDTVEVTGPHGIPFPIPTEPDATLVLIGTGTGIAPFRSFIKTLHRKYPNWSGTVFLFYGKNNGLDVLYTNDPDEDLKQYFDKETFEAFKSLSAPLNWADPITWDLAYSERGSELLTLMGKPATYVYVAGREEIRNRLDALFGQLLGSENQWALQKQELVAANRWIELLY